MREAFNREVRLYKVLLVFFFLVGGISAIFWVYFREVIYDYKFYIPGAESGTIEFQYGVWPALTNPDFYVKVRGELVENRTTFIEADLSAMALRFYRDGALEKSFDIIAKGKPGSWWETPAGLYRISEKAKNHFSSFGRVYQPFSMVFQGNFFIHGWPYYPGGAPVASTYSGGCIRLSTEDAEELFAFAGVGTPVLVYESEAAADNFQYKFATPDVSAQSYLAADLKNNFVFLRKNERDPMPIASLTKLVTAMIAMEYVNLSNNIRITEAMLASTSRPRFTAGKRFVAFELLFPLLMESSNEAAAAFAEVVGETRFMSLMNRKAESLGMLNTKFEDVSGADAGNVSTAEDLFALAKNVYENRSVILRISAGNLKDATYTAPSFKNLENVNEFAGDPEFVGGTTGETTSGQTVLSVFELDLGGEKRPVVIIALGSIDHAGDVRAIKNYIQLNYAELVGAGDAAASL